MGTMEGIIKVTAMLVMATEMETEMDTETETEKPLVSQHMTYTLGCTTRMIPFEA